MKRTNEQIIDFLNDANRYVPQKGEDKKPKDTKLRYAINKMKDRAMKLHQKYLGQIEDERIAECIEDKDKGIARGPQDQYMFTKDGLKAVLKRQRELAEEEVEIEPYFATSLPADFDINDYQHFEGFVVPEQTEPPTE